MTKSANKICMDIHGKECDIRYLRVNKDMNLSESDLIAAASGISRKESCRIASILRKYPKLRNIIQEIDSDSIVFWFPGQGNKDGKLLSIESSYKLIMIIPGTNAARMRVRLLKSLMAKLSEMGEEKAVATILELSLKEHVEELEDDPPQTEFVYAIATDAFPGLVKIGRTNDISTRLCSLNTAVSPMPFYIVAIAPTLDSHRDEAKAHEHFQDCRVAGEFFRVSKEDVSKWLQGHILQVFNLEIQNPMLAENNME